MCTERCIRFGRENLKESEVRGKRVVELGAGDVNGSLRPFVESMRPTEYIGVDITKGPGVDVICPAEKARERFGDESFDLVISTEMVEHIQDWRTVISNMKHICRPGGVILLTVPSIGFPYHGWPYDFWRFEDSDMKDIFSDCTISVLERDDDAHGTLMKAVKGSSFVEKDLSPIALHSIITGGRTRTVDDETVRAFVGMKKAEMDASKPKGFRRFRRNLDRIVRKIWKRADDRT